MKYKQGNKKIFIPYSKSFSYLINIRTRDNLSLQMKKQRTEQVRVTIGDLNNILATILYFKTEKKLHFDYEI